MCQRDGGDVVAGVEDFEGQAAAVHLGGEFVPVGAGFVEDVAGIAVNAGQSNDNMILDAVGPEIFRYEELIRLIADRVQSKARIIHLRPGLALFLSKFIGYMVNDVVLTRDEVEGLMANLLVSENPPTGKTRLSEWLTLNASIGTSYASELARHYRCNK